MSKTYCTIPVSELNTVNYDDLHITSADSAPRNIAGDSALIKWSGTMPASVSAITGKGTPMTHSEARALMRSADWAEEL